VIEVRALILERERRPAAAPHPDGHLDARVRIGRRCVLVTGAVGSVKG